MHEWYSPIDVNNSHVSYPSKPSVMVSNGAGKAWGTRSNAYSPNQHR